VTSSVASLGTLALLALSLPASATELADTDLLDDEGQLESQEIINGEEATADDYPMTGGVIFDGTIDMGSWGSAEMRAFMCSSTLIAPDTVLLAAHCIDDVALTYGLGEVTDKTYYWTRLADLSDHDGTTIADLPDDAVASVAFVAHEDFDLYGMSVGIADNADIALIFLEEAVTDVPFAYLPQNADEDDQLIEDAELTVVGWGQQTATSGWTAPPAGTYLYKMMGESYVGELGEAEFQVGVEEDDVRKCHGDSGGPSFQLVDTDLVEDMRLVGVTSHAYDSTDCNSKGGVDTRVSAYLEWIDTQMVSACEDGTRVWCEQEGIPVVDAGADEDENSDLGILEGDDGAKACGCAAPSVPASAWLLLGSLGLLVRRRR